MSFRQHSRTGKITLMIAAFAVILTLCPGLGLQSIKADEAKVSSGFEKLDEYVDLWKESQKTYFGYPSNQKSTLDDFYQWYVASGMDVVNLNNAGDPMTDNPSTMSTQEFEKEVIEFFAPYYDFDLDNVWGLVTHSGTDGNNHGIYFGASLLKSQTGLEPIVYVSDEAHYSNFRLCDLQNLEVQLIKSDEMGRMIPEELEKELDVTRPCLIIYAMGSTFKGAIDDMATINMILDSHPEIPGVYRHVDAALFGGYLPFTEYSPMVSHKEMEFDSIAVSGHKFFGIDSPCGLFICTKEVYDGQDSFEVPYLNNDMRMINCSRDAIQPLKFWWLIQTMGHEKWCEQASNMMDVTKYLIDELEKIGWPHWHNNFSNTVFFKRPSQEIVHKYILAGGYDERFGGELSHIVVMQQVTRDAVDMFIADLKNEMENNTES